MLPQINLGLGVFSICITTYCTFIQHKIDSTPNLLLTVTEIASINDQSFLYHIKKLSLSILFVLELTKNSSNLFVYLLICFICHPFHGLSQYAFCCLHFQPGLPLFQLITGWRCPNFVMCKVFQAMQLMDSSNFAALYSF